MGALPPGEVNLLLLGDWGNGKQSQKNNAKAMAEYIAGTGVQFNAALTVGDNFYVKMRDANDWYFQGLFEDMYDARRSTSPSSPAWATTTTRRPSPRAARSRPTSARVRRTAPRVAVEGIPGQVVPRRLPARPRKSRS